MTNKRILTLITLLLFLLLLAGCWPWTINKPPEIISDPVTTATVGVPYTYDVEATDPDAEDVLTYTLISVEPPGMEINPVSGEITWTPTIDDVGDVDVTVEVSDGKLSDTQDFTITVSAVVVELDHIVVLPETMDLFVGESDFITSVTAHYSDGTDNLPDNWTYDSDPTGIVDVDVITGEVTPKAVGETTITVSYEEDGITRTDTIEVTVKLPSPVIDGILSPGEWDCATVIPVASSMGTVRVLATTDYLYVAFDVDDPTDARLDQNLGGNDQTSINVNPTDGGPYGMPCDIVFQTGADPDAFTTPDPDIPDSSGNTDGYSTEWCIDGVQLDLPGDLETKTIYNGNRISEWKVPLASIVPSVGDVLKVGGSVGIDVPVNLGYVYPADLDPLWSDASTYIEIIVY